MSSLYEQMISAAIDVQLQASASTNSSSSTGAVVNTGDSMMATVGHNEHAFSYPPPHHLPIRPLDDYPSHVFSSQMNVIPPGCRFQQTTMHHLASEISGNSGIDGNGNEVTLNKATTGTSEMSSNNSSSATAITILTPEPTESASSSAGGSPRSVCSTLTSEQVPDPQLILAEHEAAEKAITCAECANYFDGVNRQPKILDCIHTFCEPCLIRRQIPFSSNPPHLSITCPLNECGQVTVVTTVAALQTNIPALTMSVVARAIQHFSSPVICDCLLNQEAGYLCYSCHQLVCQNCAMTAHATPQHNLESLDALNLNSLDAANVSRLVDRLRVCRASAPSLMTVMCPRHPSLPVFSYCETCSQPVCQDCTPNHFSTKVGDHVTIHLLKGFDAQTYKHECGFFAAYIKHIRQSVMQLRTSLDAASRAQATLQDQHQNSNIAVLQQFDQYVAKATNLQKLYAEQSDDFLSGITLAGGLDKFMVDVDQLRDECRRLNQLFERARENCSAAEMSSLREWVKRKVFDIRQRCRSINQSVNIKRRHSLPLDMRPLVDNELPKLFDTRPESNICQSAFGPPTSGNVTAGSNNNYVNAQFSRYQQAAVANIAQQSQQFQPLAPRFSTSATTSTTVSTSRTPADYFQQPQPLTSGWPSVSTANSPGAPAITNPYYHRLISAFTNQQVQKHRLREAPTQVQQTQAQSRPSTLPTGAYPGQLYLAGQSQASLNATLTPVSSYSTSSSTSTTPTYDMTASQLAGHDCVGGDEIETVDLTGHHQIESGVVTDSPLLMAPTSVAIPNRLQLRYIAKIGQFGEADGQFTEPSGIATNHQNQLVVADTNSHRIQVFNNHGAFLWRFGECGKRAGQVLYPNRIAIGPEGEYVFTERAPQCLVQVFDAQGTFIRRFGSGDLRHPRGLCIDPDGHVLVLECQVMSVTIYDMRGTRLRRFTFEGIRFPSSICVNDQQEIFIADNIQHYVYVYSYDGAMKRRIGGYPTINFPVGVAINHLGQLVVADNHNNFNITVFTQDGTPISGYESCVKHAQVLDVCLLNAGRAVAISCKDYRVYVYPYQDCTSGSMIDVGSNGDV